VHAFDFGPGEDNSGSDFRVLKSHMESQLDADVLIFTDSRGSAIDHTGNISNCWPDQLFEHLSRHGVSVLFISRPKDITVFFSLVNFLSNNNVKFKHLITNVGFVDFTPKKISVIEDIRMQIPKAWPAYEYDLETYPPYQLSDGNLENLYSLRYDHMRPKLCEFLKERFRRSFLIGTLECDQTIPIQRKRPDAFFKQLKVTNHFLFDLANSHHSLQFIQPLRFQEPGHPLMTYDGVHFTKLGHRIITDVLTPYLNHFIIGS
jgi:hypothetical protein